MPSVRKNKVYKKKSNNHRHENKNTRRNRLKGLLKPIIEFAKKDISFTSSIKERKFELRRKCFHLIGLIFPVATILFEKNILLTLSMSITVITVVADYKNWIFFLKKIPRGNLLIQLFREYELIHGQLCGLSWLFIGYTIVLSSCDKYLVAMSMAVLTISDATAAIIGKNFGKRKICGNKTLEGSLGFFMSGLLVITFFISYIVPPLIVFNIYFLIVALLFCTIVELVAKNIMIDDNCAIPIVFCFTYKILVDIFYYGIFFEKI